MKKTILTLVSIILIISMGFAKVDKVSFFSPGSFYVYVEGGTFGINPYEPYGSDGEEWSATMIYGAGFTLLNIHNRYKLNFEFDFASPKYDVYSDHSFYEQGINFYNYKLNFEYLFRGGRFIIFGGIGITNIRYLENDLYYDHSYTVMLVETGVKIALSRKLFLRAELKFFADTGDDYSYDYYYYDDSYPIGGALAVGLEYKF